MFDKIFNIGLKDLLDSMPAEHVTLKEALEGRLEIHLNNGLTHKFDAEELKKISKVVPLYLWSLIRVPLIFVKLPSPGEYRLNGSEWDQKALSIILGEERPVLSGGQMESLLRQYKSLIFITLSHDSISGTERLEDEL